MSSLLDPLRHLRNSLKNRIRRAQDGRHSATEPDLKGDRAIEVGWILSRAGAVPSRVLEVGSGGGVMAGYLAGMGHSVICIDPFEAPWHLPTRRVAFVQGDVNTAEFPCKFELITACSSVEHIGLGGRYGIDHDQIDGDLSAISAFKKLLAPSGRILMTIPVGQDAVINPHHRIYGATRLPQLLSGLAICAEAYWWKADGAQWAPCLKEQALSVTGTKSFYALGLYELALAQTADAPEPVTGLTFMTSCKPFIGRDAENQNLALQSWRNAGVEVVIAGDEAAQAASTQDLTIVAQIRRAEDLQSAAPYLRSIVEAGLQMGTSPWLCLSNADIVIPEDFKARLDRLVRRHGSNAIFAARRRNLHVHRADLQERMPLPADEWSFYSPLGSDVFIASRPMWEKILAKMPDFVFGRVTWDNWMHCSMIRLGKPVDASWPLEAYHLPHDYQIQNGESLDVASHTQTPADRHNRALFQASEMRVGELGDVSVDGHWFTGESS